jgi:hypothetical protein
VKYVFYAILIYLAYQLIFKLIIPVYIASRRFKKQFREMHTRMQEQMNQQQATEPPPTRSAGSKPVSPGDYIEFEEVK